MNCWIDISAALQHQKVNCEDRHIFCILHPNKKCTMLGTQCFQIQTPSTNKAWVHKCIMLKNISTIIFIISHCVYLYECRWQYSKETNNFRAGSAPRAFIFCLAKLLLHANMDYFDKWLVEQFSNENVYCKLFDCKLFPTLLRTSKMHLSWINISNIKDMNALIRPT